MDLKTVTEEQKREFNKLATHVMQSWEWGEFRKTLGPTSRFAIYDRDKMVEAFQLTLHKIPLIPYFVGYLPKGPFPDQELAKALKVIGKKYRCALIKIEPDIIYDPKGSSADPLFRLSSKPYFTKYNYVLDLAQPEEVIFKNMHPKFRYNIKVAQKHGVVIEERTDDEALKVHLDLYFETITRQGFHGHNRDYHQRVWKALKQAGMVKLLIAFYTPEGSREKIPLSSWMLVNFKDTLYYPYGGSTERYKNVMASNLVAWEAIRLGKRLKLKKFDLWGAGNLQKGPQDSYFGFTQFKSRIGGQLVEYMGTYDLVLNWPVYWAFTFIDKLTPLKVFLLKLLGKN